MSIKGLSVCIIAKNEERFLADCLESVKSIANEIILVDTGSIDNTIKIAESYNCKIIKSDWKNDFSYSRNIALENAQYDCILSIDADERLLNPQELITSINNSPDNVGGWLIEVKSEAKRTDGGNDIYVSNLLRLFKNHPEIRFTGIIHEQIIESVLKCGLKLENTAIKILHLGYTHSPNEMKQKQMRNLELLTSVLKSYPNDGNYLYHISKTYLALGELQLAEDYMQKCLKYVNPNGATKPQALNFGAVIAFQLKNNEMAINRAKESLNIIPTQAFANFILGEAYSAMEKFQEAITAYLNMEKAYNNPDVISQIVGDYYLPKDQLHFRLGRAYVGLQQFEKAFREFEEGNKVNPNDTSNLVGLANIYYFKKEFQKSKEYLYQAQKLEPNRTDLNMFLKQVQNAERDSIISNISVNIDTEPIIREKSEKPLVSLSMILKNEEKNLVDCFNSVRNFVDEIVVVDTGSTDKTKEIALKLGAKVFDFPWIDDFAAARNECLKHCNGEWILYLDADERLEAENSELFRNLLKSQADNIGGLICTLESSHLQLDGSTELHRGGYPRIFRNYGYPNIKFIGRVHEQITPSLFALGKSIPFSDIIIKHLGYDQSREIMEAKVKRNYKMLLAHVNEEPLNAYAWYQLGQTLAQMNIYKEAESAIRFAIQIGSLSDSVYASASSTLAQMVGNQKKFDEALFWAEKSLEKAPDQIYALNLKAYSLLYLDKNSEAEQLFIEVNRRQKSKKGVPHSGFDIIIPDKIIEHGLNEARRKQGKI